MLIVYRKLFDIKGKSIKINKDKRAYYVKEPFLIV